MTENVSDIVREVAKILLDISGAVGIGEETYYGDAEKIVTMVLEDYWISVYDD